jgi:RsmE family RNA methyltransferase
MKAEKHLFALFWSDLSAHCTGTKDFVARDSDLLHRITKVLRLEAGETFQLFNETHYATLTLDTKTFSSKNTVVASIDSVKPVQPIMPPIDLYPALLKKDDFETACSMAAALGARLIQPLITHKIQKNWLEDKDLARIQKIMIAACEQSKNFCIPTLKKPIKLADGLAELKTAKKLHLDVNGSPFFEVAQELRKTKPQSIALLCGPEADLTLEEQALLKTHEVEFVKLTPTTLKSVDAITIGLGALRSVL